MHWGGKGYGVCEIMLRFEPIFQPIFHHRWSSKLHQNYQKETVLTHRSGETVVANEIFLRSWLHSNPILSVTFGSATVTCPNGHQRKSNLAKYHAALALGSYRGRARQLTGNTDRSSSHWWRWEPSDDTVVLQLSLGWWGSSMSFPRCPPCLT